MNKESNSGNGATSSIPRFHPVTGMSPNGHKKDQRRTKEQAVHCAVAPKRGDGGGGENQTLPRPATEAGPPWPSSRSRFVHSFCVSSSLTTLPR